MDAHTTIMRVTDGSHVGSVRRFASDMASRTGLDGTAVGEAAIVTTELANNLLLHAAGGVLLFRPLADGPAVGLEVLALDSGGGMRDADACMRDGFSTAGTAGNGLGAVQRLSRAFDIYSAEGAGCAVLSQVWGGCPDVPNLSTMEVGAVSVPHASEEVCGDAWAVHNDGRRQVFALADGLGHGLSASTASLEAIRVFRSNVRLHPEEILWLAHGALRGTRGAAMAVAELDLGTGQIRYAGVGNIAAVVVGADGERHSMVSLNGTIGHSVRKIQEFEYLWQRGATFIMSSDGLATQWNLERYAGLRRHHPSVIAGILYRDFQRGSDDATVIVARVKPDRGPVLP